MFATAGANFMTFQELNNCLKTFNFNLTSVEKLALMKKMDEDGDNEISKEEFFNALA
jgi:Ca2+-binding EF-hand superfamily protein